MHLPSSSILLCRISTVVSILIIIYIYIHTYLDDVPFHADTFIVELQVGIFCGSPILFDPEQESSDKQPLLEVFCGPTNDLEAGSYHGWMGG